MCRTRPLRWRNRPSEELRRAQNPGAIERILACGPRQLLGPHRTLRNAIPEESVSHHQSARETQQRPSRRKPVPAAVRTGDRYTRYTDSVRRCSRSLTTRAVRNGEVPPALRTRQALAVRTMPQMAESRNAPLMVVKAASPPAARTPGRVRAYAAGSCERLAPAIPDPHERQGGDHQKHRQKRLCVSRGPFLLVLPAPSANQTPCSRPVTAGMRSSLEHFGILIV